MNALQRAAAKLLGFSHLIDAANPIERWRRPQEPLTANALTTDVSLADWLNLVSDSRKLYYNLGPIKGAIDDKAMYSVGRAWDPKFTGTDKKWGEQAEAWLRDSWYPVADVRGGMFDFKTGLFLTSVSVDRDSEIYIRLTEAKNGWPQYQLIPAHMIGSRERDTSLVPAGPYRGLRNIQGVIVNASGMAVAYNVMDPVDADKDEIVSARDLIQVFEPLAADQVRGFPSFTHAILDLKDLRTIQGNEKIVSQIASTIGLMEWNEQGAPDPNDPMNALTRVKPADSTHPEVTTQTINGVRVNYFRSGSGSKMEQLKNERPGDVWDRFMNRLIRNACAGAGWPYELVWDGAALGGANVRLLIAKAMRAVEDRQDLLRPIAKRVCGYAVAKAIRNGILPPNEEWYKWRFTMPGRMTADYGRDGNSDREDYKLGVTNLGDILAEEGRDLDQHIAERKEENDKLAAAGLSVAERQKSQLDLIGIGVRAGIITPSAEVEAQIRELTGLPPMSEDVQRSWKESQGVRAPITIAQNETPEGVAAKGAEEKISEEE